jgi:hypothetical protein
MTNETINTMLSVAGILVNIIAVMCVAVAALNVACNDTDAAELNVKVGSVIWFASILLLVLT